MSRVTGFAQPDGLFIGVHFFVFLLANSYDIHFGYDVRSIVSNTYIDLKANAHANMVKATRNSILLNPRRRIRLTAKHRGIVVG